MKKWLNELATQTGFGPMSLEQSRNKFKKKFKNMEYAQQGFDTVVNAAMVGSTPLKDEMENYFNDNNPEDIKQQPFRIKGKLTEQDDKGNWDAELYINVYDWENPGIVMTDTLTIHTGKPTRKEALDMMKEMTSKIAAEYSEKFGIPATMVDMKTGKRFEAKEGL